MELELLVGLILMSSALTILMAVRLVGGTVARNSENGDE